MYGGSYENEIINTLLTYYMDKTNQNVILISSVASSYCSSTICSDDAVTLLYLSFMWIVLQYACF